MDSLNSPLSATPAENLNIVIVFFCNCERALKVYLLLGMSDAENCMNYAWTIIFSFCSSTGILQKCTLYIFLPGRFRFLFRTRSHCYGSGIIFIILVSSNIDVTNGHNGTKWKCAHGNGNFKIQNCNCRHSTKKASRLAHNVTEMTSFFFAVAATVWTPPLVTMISIFFVAVAVIIGYRTLFLSLPPQSERDHSVQINYHPYTQSYSKLFA